MPILEILEYPNPLLRDECKAVGEIDQEIKATLNNMVETMYHAQGIGLAASQVGIMKRLIVLDIGDDEKTGRIAKLYKIINPEIINSSGSTEYEEGCLSIPGIKEKVKRASSVTVVGLDEHGSKIQIDAEGLLAICLQHEIDHLNGILFIDHLSRLKREMLKKKLANFKKNE